MLRISKLSDYAIVLLVSMAEQPGYIVNAASLANSTGIAKPTVTKLLKILAADGLLHSALGRNGGYRLALPPAQISMQRIIEAIEGPIALTECNQDDSDCNLAGRCHPRAHWRLINRVVREALAGVSLAEIRQQMPTEVVDNRPGRWHG